MGSLSESTTEVLAFLWKAAVAWGPPLQEPAHSLGATALMPRQD